MQTKYKARVIWDCFGFFFSSISDWSRKLVPIQSNGKLKLIRTCSPAFSRALRSLLVFTLNSHLILLISFFVLIGCSNNSMFGNQVSGVGAISTDYHISTHFV